MREEAKKETVDRKQIETRSSSLLAKEGSGLTDFVSSPRVPLEISQLGGLHDSLSALYTPSTYTDQEHRYVCVCARAHALRVYSPAADICVSFVLPSLKPHDTCHLSQMAECRTEMQRDDNRLCLQSKVTQLQAVHIGISAASPLAVADAHTHTVACKE